MKENGLRIDHAKQSNTKVTGRKDVIQISTTEHQIQFDLEPRMELANNLYYDQFNKSSQYHVETGFTDYILTQD